MREIKFSVDNKEFFCDLDVLSENSFTVKSFPKSYRVTFYEDKDIFSALNALLRKNPGNLLVIDEKLVDLYRPTLEVNSTRVLKVVASENFKTLNGVTEILDFLQKNEFTKADQLIVVGGGIVQDVCAFVSAIYKRGIPWILFPSTLLAMCDSCIGGKGGVNYQDAKNQLALFSAPIEIYINPNFAGTLMDDTLRSGLGEVLKLCIIGGNYFIKIYEQHVVNGKIKSFESVGALIRLSLTIKKTVIEEDEFELNYRRSLNYGHTLGHAIEALSHYEIPHGQAVVIGMMLVNALSAAQGIMIKADLVRLNALCYDLLDDGVMICLEKINVDSMLSLIQRDKKTVGRYTSFVLIKSPGEVQLVKLELNQQLLSDIKSAFDCLMKDQLLID